MYRHVVNLKRCILNRFYRIVYDESEVNPPEKVLELACGRLGEKKYHPLTDNCEHFCTECKIGKSLSIQVNIKSFRFNYDIQIQYLYAS